MPKEELTNNRPGNYSHWHRERLPGWCFNTDGDWFEQRKKGDTLVVVAYIETIQIPLNSLPDEYPVWDSKINLAKEINDKMFIPCFFVWHYPDCSYFFIKRIGKDHYIMMKENDYINFIKGL